MKHIYEEAQFEENWFTYPNFYREIVKKFPSGSKFVEVGVWKGKSASYMCVEIANSNKNIEFYCVDNWKGSIEHLGNPELPKLYEIFTKNMEPVKDHYTPVKMNSLEAVNLFPNESLDFVFIDASHEYEDVKEDIKAWLPKVKIGGILAGHDYHHQPIKDALKFNNLTIEERLNDDCWIHYKGKKSYQIFAL